MEYGPAIPVENGLKVRVGDKASWWATRWMDALNGLGWSSRLQRGRTYARKGQVIDFEIENGTVRASVQGSRPEPYHVTLSLKPFTAKEWERASAAMAAEAGFTAHLLAGTMPHGIEAAFITAGLSLLPRSGEELRTECSCPDFANPCKHIAALHYVLASHFDRDPFLIFELRGRPREAVVPAPQIRQEKSAAHFWDVPPGDPLTIAPKAPEESAALVRCLGDPPFWNGRGSLAEALAPVYRAASKAALAWAVD